MLKGIYLTLLAGPVIPVPVPQVALDALQSVEITVSSELGAQSAFKLDFSLSNDSPLHTIFLLAGGGIVPFIRVILVATISGIPEVLIDGVVTNQSVTPGGAGSRFSTLSISGVDLSALMDLVELDGLPYPAMPIEARVAFILAKYVAFGIVPLPIPPLFFDIPNPLDRIPIHQGTDFKYLTKLAEQVGYVFYLNPGPAPGTSIAYFGPQIKVGVPQSALNINMDAQTNCDDLRFAFHTEKATLPVLFIQDPTTKIPIPIPIPAINPLQPPLGLIPPIPKTIEFLNDTANLDPMEALALGVATASRSQDAVTADGSIDVIRYGGILHARGLVGVRGAGPAFDGLYYVESVTHHLKRGEYKQDFKLSRNGLVSITPRVPA
jgi:hypothetical protein